jgi:hypothetical protein
LANVCQLPQPLDTETAADNRTCEREHARAYDVRRIPTVEYEHECEFDVGIDYLDFNFRLEKMHGLIVTKGAIADLTPRREEFLSKWLKIESWDIRVGQFYEVIRNNCVALCPDCPHSRRLTIPIQSAKTDPAQYLCPKCGKALSPYPLTWEQFRTAMAQTLGAQEAEIEPEKWLRRELGFD